MRTGTQICLTHSLSLCDQPGNTLGLHVKYLMLSLAHSRDLSGGMGGVSFHGLEALPDCS